MNTVTLKYMAPVPSHTMQDETADFDHDIDPTDRMIELQERSIPSDEDDRGTVFRGSESTEDDDVDPMLQHL